MFDIIMKYIRDFFVEFIISGVFIATTEKLYEIRNNTHKTRKYTEKELNFIKVEFYCGFFLAIALIILPQPNIHFLVVGKQVFTVLFLCLSLMAFLCLSDGIQPTTVISTHEESENHTGKKTDNEAD